MQSPAAAMGWQLWRRYRWLAAAGVVWFALSSIACRLLPENAYNDVVVFLTAVPLLFLLGWQVAVFTYGSEADLSSKESGYPPWMLRHPVSVRLLVGWPMFLGVMTVAALWMAIAWGVLRSRGVEVLVLRPALISAAVLAWSQVLIWSPFGLGWLRVFAILGVVAMVTATAMLDVVCGMPEVAILALLAAYLPAAYWAAIVGVSRARRGDTPEWRWLPMAVARVAAWIPRRGRPFGSAIRAQAWFEWRRHGLGPPLIVGIALPLAVIFILVNQTNPNFSDDSLPVLPLSLLLLAAFVALTGGVDFGNLGSTKTDRGVPGFLFVRPISDMELIGAKYLAAAKSAAAVCLITALALAVCVILTGGLRGIDVLRERLGYDAWWIQPPVLVPSAFLLLWVHCWVSFIHGLCVGLTGREWVAFIFATAGGALFVNLILLGLWLSMHSEYHQACWNAVPGVVGSLALLKLTLAGYVLRRAWERGLLETSAIAILVGVWASAVLATVGLTAWLAPSGLAPIGLAAGGTILMYPLTRIALAPLALAWNRHR